MKTIYECNYYMPSIFSLIPLLFLAIGIYLLLNVKNPFLEKPVLLWVFGIAFTVVGAFAVIFSVIDIVSSYKDIVLPYHDGVYTEIEGEVTDLKITPFLGNGNDTFSVNGVDFEIGGIKPGYQKQAAYGGAITHNSQYVKIKYINSNEINYIMSLSLIE